MLLLLPFLLLGGCNARGGTAPPHGRVLLIGLDGAEWDLIRPMVEAGELPNLARLMKNGVHGNLRSLEPLAKSPTIWTTIATGKAPTEHGIGAFVEGRRDQPLTRNVRAVEAVWNIASMAGRTTGIVGWLVSWPAEQVNGFMVSDYIQYGGTTDRRMEGRVYPESLGAEIDPLVIRSSDVSWSDVQKFLDAPPDTAAMDSELERILRPLKWTSAADLSFTRIAERLYRERRPDLFAVYLRGMDSMGHCYWNYMSPDAVPRSRLNPEGLKLLKGTMRAYYRHTDELVGRILRLADDQTTVIVVSDHGFKGGPGHGIELHKLDGVFIMAGRNVARGEISGASVYDVTPTVLVLLGLPPARDMRGKVLWSALGRAIPRNRFAAVIPTYETGKRRGPGAPMPSPIDEELRERLRALGYLK